MQRYFNSKAKVLASRQLLLYWIQLLFILAVLVMFSLFHIEFHELYWRIFISNTFITTDPDLNVISCGRRQLYIEPWW